MCLCFAVSLRIIAQINAVKLSSAPRYIFYTCCWITLKLLKYYFSPKTSWFSTVNYTFTKWLIIMFLGFCYMDLCVCDLKNSFKFELRKLWEEEKYKLDKIVYQRLLWALFFFVPLFRSGSKIATWIFAVFYTLPFQSQDWRRLAKPGNSRKGFYSSELQTGLEV